MYDWCIKPEDPHNPPFGGLRTTELGLRGCQSPPFGGFRGLMNGEVLIIELLRIIFLKMRYTITLSLFFSFIMCSEAQTSSTDWPLFRGKADLSGKVEFELPSAPKLLWSIKTGGSTKSSPVLVDETVYFGNDKGSLIAVNTDGTTRWKFESGASIDAAPMVYGEKVIFGANDGILRAVDKLSGKLSWSYTTDNKIAGSANVWIAGNKAGIVAGSYDYFLHCVDPETGK